MRSISRWMASATVGGLALLCASPDALGQSAAFGTQPVGRVSAAAAGSIRGVVQDETGAPVGGASVSALGATTASAFTDRYGRFELWPLSPGPYLVRAHLSGFMTSHGQILDVRAGSRTSSSMALRRTAAFAPVVASVTPVLTASLGGLDAAAEPSTAPASPADERDEATEASSGTTDNDDHSELAWRLRHLRRGILQDSTLPKVAIADQGDAAVLGPLNAFSRVTGSPARLAASLFGAAPLSGQLNLLTTSSFDSPQQLFSSDNMPRSVAYIALGAPAGSNANWAVRGAFNQADISSWIVAGAYSTRGPARHRYDVGLSFATQRYDGGNPAALRDVTDGSRNAGAVYGFDAFTITPAIVLTYGARYARYDYLDGQSLLSPRVTLTVSPGDHFRLNSIISRRATAPGAEEFLPPSDNGIWLPPQRTFSLLTGRRLAAERTTHIELEAERDLGEASTISVRAFRQRVDDQLVTMFGVEVPGLPPATLGHYFVGNSGEVAARGVGATFRTAIAGRVHGSIEYSMTRTAWNPGEDLSYWMLQLPSTTRLRSGRIHDLATAVETQVPETSTRVAVLYRVSNAFARRSVDDDALFDSRFDVQVRQALPFMDFSTARWEMLIGVRNFFRETVADQSVYDELLVVHPPKRLVGGLTMRF